MGCNCGQGAQARNGRAHPAADRLRAHSSANDLEGLFEISYQVDPIAEAKMKAADALARTEEGLKKAISDRDAKRPISRAVESAMARFFKGSTPKDLDRLLLRVGQVRGWMASLPVRKVISTAGYSDPIQQMYIAKHLAARSPEAYTFPVNMPKKTTAWVPMIAVYPAWYAEPGLGPTRLIHEAFHYSYYPSVRHGSPGCSWDNAFAWQGLVSVLGGLPVGAKLNNACPP
jgi:hypothetical protein